MEKKLDLSIPGTPAPSAPTQPSTPAQPVVPPAGQPVSAPSPAPQFSSRILQGASNISAQPFQAPAVSGPAPFSSAPLATSTALATPNASVNGIGAIPKESAGFSAAASSAPKAAGGAVPPKLPTPATVGGGFADKFKNPKVLLGAALGIGALLLAVGAFLFMNNRGASVATNGSPAPKTNKNVKLTYWGLWEPESVMKTLISEYEQANPGVKIEYRQEKSEQYRQRLQAALRDGSGPDIFRFHNTWVPMLSTDLAPASRGTLTSADVEKNYYPVVSKDLAKGGQLYGIPFMYEGLALLYNESMLQAANAQPPKDWEQVRQLASSLTVKSGTRIERAGIALGTTSNVDNFSDVLATMMLQNSGNPGNPVTDNERHALTFYTIFSRVDAVWDDSMPSSTLAFANEKAAMIIAPSWRIFEIQRMNPNLKFGVARLPQLSDETVTWASYWAEGVSKQSKNADEAWKFLAWMSQPEQLRKFHSQAASVRGFGEMYPRVDMASELKENTFLSPYLEDALFARSWYLASMTHDEGINDKLIQYYTDAVNQMNTRPDAEQAFTQILPGIQQVFSQYGLSLPASGTP